jgi:long-chain acyl-CoA synthetase
LAPTSGRAEETIRQQQQGFRILSSKAVIQTIPNRFRATARQWAQAPVVVGCGRDLSYDELDTASDGVAGSLAAAGIQPGERIALYCPNGTEFVIAYLGILKAGACVVPVHLMLNPLEVGFILRDAGARGLFYHASLAGSATQALDEAPAAGLRVCIGACADASEGVADLDAMAASGLAPPVLDLDPTEALAAILYTSGTTGRPKGAMLSHANLSANAEAVMQALGLTPGRDRILVVLPMFHAFAATVGMLMPLLHGLSLIPVLRFDPRQVSAAVADHGATVFLGVPSMYALLLRLDETAVALWRGVRLCVCGGAAMPQAVMAGFEARFGIPLLEGDGPTECSPVTCVNPVGGPRKPGSVGPAIPGVAMRIAGPDGSTLPDGEHGEVCVCGPNVMRGYWRLPDETAASFFGDWFRTGDLGWRDADGYFYLVDRIKDLIITNGMNVYPRVIEEALYQHPDLAEAAVVAEPHPLHGELPIAYVVAKPGLSLDPVALRDWCRARLGRHEVPRRILVREALPRNAAGKILKRELRRQGELDRGVDLPSATPGPAATG